MSSQAIPAGVTRVSTAIVQQSPESVLGAAIREELARTGTRVRQDGLSVFVQERGPATHPHRHAPVELEVHVPVDAAHLAGVKALCGGDPAAVAKRVRGIASEIADEVLPGIQVLEGRPHHDGDALTLRLAPTGALTAALRGKEAIPGDITEGGLDHRILNQISSWGVGEAIDGLARELAADLINRVAEAAEKGDVETVLAAARSGSWPAPSAWPIRAMVVPIEAVDLRFAGMFPTLDQPELLWLSRQSGAIRQLFQESLQAALAEHGYEVDLRRPEPNFGKTEDVDQITIHARAYQPFFHLGGLLNRLSQAADGAFALGLPEALDRADTQIFECREGKALVAQSITPTADGAVVLPAHTPVCIQVSETSGDAVSPRGEFEGATILSHWAAARIDDGEANPEFVVVAFDKEQRVAAEVARRYEFSEVVMPMPRGGDAEVLRSAWFLARRAGVEDRDFAKAVARANVPKKVESDVVWPYNQNEASVNIRSWRTQLGLGS